MWEKLKATLATGGALVLLAFGIVAVLGIGLVVTAAQVLLGAALGAWLLADVFPWVVRLANVLQLLAVLVLRPVAIFRKARGFSGKGLLLISGVNGVALFVSSGIVLFQNWGIIGVALGFVFFLIGMVPLALLSLVTKGNWPVLGQLAYLTAFVVVAWLIGLKFIKSASVRPHLDA